MWELNIKMEPIYVEKKIPFIHKRMAQTCQGHIAFPGASLIYLSLGAAVCVLLVLHETFCGLTAGKI